MIAEKRRAPGIPTPGPFANNNIRVEKGYQMARGITAPRYLKNRAALAHAHYVAAQAQLSPCATRVYKLLASDTDFRTWRRSTRCIKQICERTGYKRPTVNKALRILRELGLIARDGYGPGAPRRVVFYRLASTPAHPLPGHVLCARGDHFPDCPCTQGPTCDSIHTPEIPTTAVPAPDPSSHSPYPAPSRSAEGVRSACASQGEGVNGTPKQRRPRPVPTAPKGRPTPRRAAHRPQVVHPALEIVAHIVSKLTPGQQRHVHRRLHATMQAQGIGPARMAERLRYWRVENPRSPVGWLLYAMATQPHGCPRPDCENGTLWDPTADAPVAPCEGCTGRIRSRAVQRNLPEESRVTWAPPSKSLGLVDCEWCETPMPGRPGVFLCRSCRGEPLPI